MSALVNSFEVRNNDLRMLCFFSWEDFFNRPFFRDYEDLRIFPYEIGPCAMIVPAEVVPILKKKGFKFDVLEPVNESDLTSQQNRALKNNKAILYRCGEVTFFMERSRYLNNKRVPS